MRKLLIAALLLPLLGCGEDVAYRPASQLLPSNIKRIALRLVVNKTQQFGLEDRFTLRVRDEFLRDGRYPLVPEANADGIVLVTIVRYLLSPIQYDSNLIPTTYKLRVIVDLQFIDRSANTALWEERNMEGIQIYPAATLPGGMTEAQAREAIWDILSRDIVKRVINGFGSVTGSSQRFISPNAPSTPPTVQPGTPQQPLNSNPY